MVYKIKVAFWIVGLVALVETGLNAQGMLTYVPPFNFKALQRHYFADYYNRLRCQGKGEGAKETIFEYSTDYRCGPIVATALV